MEDARELWDKVRQVVKRGKVNLPFWDALDSSIPIVIEDNCIIVGLAPQDMHKSGHLSVALSRRTVETALQELSPQVTTYRIIEGTDIEDWEMVKQREEALRRQRITGVEQARLKKEAVNSWEALSEQLMKSYSATKQRNFPQVLAQFLTSALEQICELETRLDPSIPEEIKQRNLARILDKLSSYTEIPPTSVALEYLRIKAARQR